MTDQPSIRFADFRRIVFFTGAGMSAESGVPTYRGEGGVWEKYNYEEYACQAAFERDPDHVWEFHDARREFIAGCDPNGGHQLIAALEAKREGVTIVTQNIDGLHQRAGSKTTFELHGSIWRVRCERCGVLVEDLTVPMADHHHECGQWWRPDIVWFGDSLRADVIDAALEGIAGCDLLVSIGTSGVVFPAAQFPLVAKKAGATLVEINPQPSMISDVFDLCLRGPATEMLPLLAGDGS